MPKGFYVCNMCKNHGEDFKVPADEIGIALMKSHLWTDHELNIDHRKALADEDLEERIYLD